jgi:uncharacterized protein (DUF362 family)
MESLGLYDKARMMVVVKPNLVIDEYNGKDIFSVITHPSVLRAIIDYCWIALKGEGKIIVADNPLDICNFEKVLEITKLEKVKDFINKFSGPKMEIYDLRDRWFKKDLFISERKLPGDPKGKVSVNIGKESAFYNYPNSSKLWGSPPNTKRTMYYHSGEKQVYEISRTILDADVLISVPKMKVHKKV